MGCDIHTYVEYRTQTPRNEYEQRWRGFGGRVNPGRNYSIFERMAGVRGDDARAVAPPRGLPDDTSYAANEDAWMWIAYGKTQEQCNENEVTEEQAAQYAKYREPEHAYRGEVKPSTWTSSWTDESGERQTKTETREAAYDGKPRWVAHPDWHSHSWLTPEEYARALSLADYATPNEEPEYYALLAAMRSLESSGYGVRLVFWFDN